VYRLLSIIEIGPQKFYNPRDVSISQNHAHNHLCCGTDVYCLAVHLAIGRSILGRSRGRNPLFQAICDGTSETRHLFVRSRRAATLPCARYELHLVAARSFGDAINATKKSTDCS
jgi:hypothetical protein